MLLPTYHFPLSIIKETFIFNSQNNVWASLGIAEFPSLGVPVQHRTGGLQREFSHQNGVTVASMEQVFSK